jgi:hypothetical protein
LLFALSFPHSGALAYTNQWYVLSIYQHGTELYRV